MSTIELSLAGGIASCPAVQDALTNKSHPCHKVVHEQTKLIDVEIYLKDNAIKVELGHDNEKNNVVSRFLNSSLIAMNDGLIFYDFYEWFLPYIKKEKVKMKIIMWTDAINY